MFPCSQHSCYGNIKYKNRAISLLSVFCVRKYMPHNFLLCSFNLFLFPEVPQVFPVLEVSSED